MSEETGGFLYLLFLCVSMIRKEAIYMEKLMISEILDSIRGLTVKELLELTKAAARTYQSMRKRVWCLCSHNANCTKGSETT